MPNSDHLDAMGCYPLFACLDWSRLHLDLAAIKDQFISLSLVTDPFGDFDLEYLRECFPDLMIPFKEHFVIDLRQSIDKFVRAHHRRNIRKAQPGIEIEVCSSPLTVLGDWMRLYGTLIERHRIGGILAFSSESFARQLAVPGIVVFRAVNNHATVGMMLWYEQHNRAYYHLAAYSQLGYEMRASFALFDYAIRWFGDRGLEWLNLGAGAGSQMTTASGLSRFKEGWSTGTRTAYLCGKVFDRKKYQEITESKNERPTEYFPAYRLGEFI